MYVSFHQRQLYVTGDTWDVFSHCSLTDLLTHYSLLCVNDSARHQKRHRDDLNFVLCEAVGRAEHHTDTLTTFVNP